MKNSRILLIIPFLIFLMSVNADWVQVSSGIGNVSVNALHVSGNNIFAGTTASGVYITTNGGVNWSLTALENVTIFSMAAIGNNIFAGGFGVYLSTNNGVNWSITALNNMSAYSLAADGNTIIAGTSQFGIFRSTNNGTNWLTSGLASSSITVYALKQTGIGMFAGTFTIGHGGYYPPGIHLSQNGGTSFSPAGLIMRNTYSIEANSTHIFAGMFFDGVFRRTLTDTTWSQTPLNNQNVRALAVHNNIVYAGTSTAGVYVTENSGASWYTRNEGLGNLNIRSLCVLNNYLYAGTSSSGVYRRLLSELVGIQTVPGIVPAEFSLWQNYPNPFNPQTVIRFGIPYSTFAELSVYDLLGRKVAELIKSELNAGTYEVSFDSQNLSSGVYYYTLNAGSYHQTKKMLLVK